MRYHIQRSDIGNFYRNTYSNRSCKLPFSTSNDAIESDALKMQISEWKSSKFKAQSIEIESCCDQEVLGSMEDNMVQLHFVSQGSASLSYGTETSFKMNCSTNNIYAGIKDEVSHRFGKQKHYEFFKVFIPYEFIDSLGVEYACVFAPLLQSIAHQEPLMLHDDSRLTTLDMQLVIDQLKRSQAMGNIAPLYFEAKVQELLFLQLQQHKCGKQNAQHTYSHYLNQVNEARRILEAQYHNPPSIKELAMMVGMSNTVLKASFKKNLGTTVYGYLYNYRMNIARTLLLDHSCTIAEVAEQSGYEHASHFTTAFKRKFGLSPVAFRRKSA